MTMQTRLRGAIAAVITTAAMFCSPTAQAAFTYSYVFGQSEYVATPGSSIFIPVYLREITTAGETPRLAVGGDNGLLSGGFVLNYGQTGGNGSVVDGDGSNADVVLNPAFDLFNFGTGFSDDSVGQLLTVEGVADFAAPIEVAAAGSSADLLIATIRFNVSAIEGNQTDLTLDLGATQLPPEFADGFAANVNQLSFGTSRIIATAVPEPSTTALGILGISGLVARRRLKRRSSQPAA